MIYLCGMVYFTFLYAIYFGLGFGGCYITQKYWDSDWGILLLVVGVVVQWYTMRPLFLLIDKSLGLS